MKDGAAPSSNTYMVVPAELLPRWPSVTIKALVSMTNTTTGSYLGSTTTAANIPLLFPPHCHLATCLSAEVQSDTFPDSAVTVSAVGFSPAVSQLIGRTGQQNPGDEILYEFGAAARLEDGDLQVNASLHHSIWKPLGRTPRYTFNHLPPGDNQLYVCATYASHREKPGARTCHYTNVTIYPPALGVDLASALAGKDVESLANTKDVRMLMDIVRLLYGSQAVAATSGGSTDFVPALAARLMDSLTSTVDVNVRMTVGESQLVGCQLIMLW